MLMLSHALLRMCIHAPSWLSFLHACDSSLHLSNSFSVGSCIDEEGYVTSFYQTFTNFYQTFTKLFFFKLNLVTDTQSLQCSWWGLALTEKKPVLYSGWPCVTSRPAYFQGDVVHVWNRYQLPLETNILVVILGLLDLADSYCEMELKKRCERLLRQRVSTDNVAVFLAVAAKYKAEVCSTCAQCHTYGT